MNSCVLDCSVTVSSFLPDEESIISEKLFREMEKGLSVWVPSIWWYEVNNVSIESNRRKKITEIKVIEIINLLKTLPISIDDNFSYDKLKNIYQLSIQHDISSYDSAYLELAIRKNMGIASLDKKLQNAAKKEKLILFNS